MHLRVKRVVINMTNVSSKLQRSAQRLKRALLGPDKIKEMLSYSQAGQDFWVYGEVFNRMKKGFFVDLGAYDGIFLSNTYLLEYRYDWDGICIEANPKTFNALRLNRNVKCVNAFVADGQQKFRLQGSGTVTYGIPDSPNQADLGDGSSQPVESETVRSFSLAHILAKANAPQTIEYLSADIEGAEEMALLNHDFDLFRFKCMTVERPTQQLRQRFEAEGYLMVKEIPGLDCFYIFKDYIEEYCSGLQKFYMSGNRFLSIFD